MQFTACPGSPKSVSTHHGLPLAFTPPTPSTGRQRVCGTAMRPGLTGSLLVLRARCLARGLRRRGHGSARALASTTDAGCLARTWRGVSHPRAIQRVVIMLHGLRPDFGGGGANRKAAWSLLAPQPLANGAAFWWHQKRGPERVDTPATETPVAARMVVWCQGGASFRDDGFSGRVP
jgi:hypothetical protein